MARFKADEVEHYGGSGNSAGFFKLSDDGDTAKVRIMYDTVDDIEGMSVHEVYINDKKRYVNCLREYNQPIEDCPFCREGKQAGVKVFIPVYDVEEKVVKVWERGKKMFNKLSRLCSRYPHLCENVFVIERIGKAKSTDTTYDIYPANGDWEKLSMEDLPDVSNLVGSYVLNKSADDMEYFLEEDEFPPTDDDTDEEPVRRRDRESSRRDQSSSRRYTGRRTPASNRRRNNDDVY